jgi:hypothetical protein
MAIVVCEGDPHMITNSIHNLRISHKLNVYIYNYSYVVLVNDDSVLGK